MKCLVVALDKLFLILTGMAQRLARGAHNSEVTRSKRVAGIFQFGSFIETVCHS